jgi:hypothetical protein
MWVHLSSRTRRTWSTRLAITERGTASLIQKYDYEIAFTDGWPARSDTSLRDRPGEQHGRGGGPDHGEAFGVHTFAGTKMSFHGQTLYHELLRIPLLVRIPAARPGPRRRPAIDAAPTILDALGLAVPAGFQGPAPGLAARRGRRPGCLRRADPHPSWNHEARAVILGDGRWKPFDGSATARRSC